MRPNIHVTHCKHCKANEKMYTVPTLAMTVHGEGEGFTDYRDKLPIQAAANGAAADRAAANGACGLLQNTE